MDCSFDYRYDIPLVQTSIFPYRCHLKVMVDVEVRFYAVVGNCEGEFTNENL